METRFSSRMSRVVTLNMRALVGALAIASLLTPHAAFAARRFWVGGYSGGEWHDTRNWSSLAGSGKAGGASVPTISDVAILHTTNSGNTIRLGKDGAAGGLILSTTFTGALRIGTSSLILGGTGARIGSGYVIVGTGTVLANSGSWTMTGGVFFNTLAGHKMSISGSLIVMGRARFRYSGTLIFNGGVADQRLAFSGSHTATRPDNMTVGKHSFSGIILNNIAGTTSDDLIISGSYLRARTLTITNGNFDLRSEDVPLALSGTLTLANDADATLETDQNITLSGSISTGASARFTMSGGTLKLNGISQNLDVAGDGSSMHTLEIDSNSGAYLTGLALVTSTLTINSSRILAFAANTLYLTGGTITNNGTIRENTGKLVHTGSNIFITNSDYTEDHEVKTGETMYFTVTDTDENINGAAADTLAIDVTLTGGDTEDVTLTETGNATGIFRGSISVTNDTATNNDGTLQTTSDRTATFTFTDAQDAKVISDTAAVTVVAGTSSSNTNSGGGSSRSRGGGGGGGGKAGAAVLAKPTRNQAKPQRRVPVTRRIAKKKLSVAERRAARLQKLKDMKARMDARRAKRLGR
ncbi:hypothetical protein HYZ99_02150 [Candidatus Peregrinibacteria bacterium]|nr:hypothetical protein [Candidatus Peregrinibacteria bacterium]